MHRELVRLDRFREDFVDEMYLKKRVTLFDTVIILFLFFSLNNNHKMLNFIKVLLL